MREKSLGRKNLTKKYELDKILDLTHSSQSDTFCDLGCGDGMLCIWASYRVRHAIGVEKHWKTCLEALANRRKRKRGNVEILHGDYAEKKIMNKLRKSTVIFCSNGLDYDFYMELEKTVKDRTYFTSQYFIPYPIMSKLEDGDWFITQTPFKLARNRKQWVCHMLGKTATMNDLYKLIKRWSDWKSKINDLKQDMEFTDWYHKKLLVNSSL